jgi:hypothetical protein
MARLIFDAAAFTARRASTAPLPAGLYTVHTVNSDLRPLRTGKGTGLDCTFEVLAGEFAGERISASLNIEHTNLLTQELGRRRLARLCKAAGVNRLRDTSELHHRPLRVRVTLRYDEFEGDRNQITDFESLDEPCLVTANRGYSDVATGKRQQEANAYTSPNMPFDGEETARASKSTAARQPPRLVSSPPWL